MSEHHLAAGSTQPPVNPNLLRLYSMKFCPYAQRTRLVLAHKNIPHDTVNVNLKQKPEWFLAKTPFALVPVLEHEGTIVYESAICNNWLDDTYPENRLTGATPNDRARDGILMAHCDKIISAFFEIFRKTNVEDAEKRLAKEFEFLEESLRGKFFGGAQPGLVDFYIWPWFERLPLLEDNGYTGFSASNYPKLHQWVEDTKALPAVQQSYLDIGTHRKFYKTFLAGTPNYDLED